MIALASDSAQPRRAQPRHGGRGRLAGPRRARSCRLGLDGRRGDEVIQHDLFAFPRTLPQQGPRELPAACRSRRSGVAREIPPPTTGQATAGPRAVLLAPKAAVTARSNSAEGSAAAAAAVADPGCSLRTPAAADGQAATRAFPPPLRSAAGSSARCSTAAVQPRIVRVAGAQGSRRRSIGSTTPALRQRNLRDLAAWP